MNGRASCAAVFFVGRGVLLVSRVLAVPVGRFGMRKDPESPDPRTALSR